MFKFTRLVMLILVGMLLFVACGGGGSSDDSTNSGDSSNNFTTKTEKMAVVSGNYDRSYWNEHFDDIEYANTNSWATMTKTLPFNEKMIIDLGLESGTEESLAKHKNPSSIYLRYWYKNRGYMYLNFKNKNGDTIHSFKFDKSGHHDSGYIEFDRDIHNDSSAEFRSEIQGFIRIENSQLKFIGEYNIGHEIDGISSKTWSISNFNDIAEVEVSIGILHTYTAGGEARIPLYIEYQEYGSTQTSENKAPIANAGENKTTTVNQTVTIIGSGTDSDGTIVSYEWKKGDTVLATTATFDYLPTVVGTDTLTLTVTDDDGATARDSVLVTVTDEINTGVCDSGYQLVYSFKISHPAGSITSSSNKVNVVKSCQKDRDIKILETNNIGSFSNKPNEYTIYYSEENRPPNGYSSYSYYSQTKYDGRHEKYMYASDSEVELIAKIKNDIDNNQCQRWAENFSGGNLNRDDNFWTYFCPKDGLISYLNSIFPTNNSGVN